VSNLIRQSQSNLDAASRGGVLGRRPVPRAVVRRAEGEAYDGLITGVRVQAAGYVTHVALSQLATLSRLEGQLINSVPMEDLNGRLKAESRARLLVDGYITVAAAEIARMAW
jgi:hypothetical protein